ncbi:S1 family peptidase [Vibrio sp. Makdt]|uniref:S1 family peptidase n=1 Tax=Vibrio sp. Makdt TaxID=2998828 RepID=UPI0022CDBBA2|nr:S1 family peptidase [Vibrio sp. Makdt]MDA0155986.1 S1 family peptidase [Vibrio sp. Makdt]
MKLKQLALVPILGLSFGAQAILYGTEVDRSNHQNLVEMNCTGSIIGGKWILTAAHCGADNGISEPIYLPDFSIVYAKTLLEHPDYNNLNVDIGLMELETAPASEQVSLLKLTDFNVGDTLYAYGFGGTGQILSYAVQTVSVPYDYAPPSPWIMASVYAGQGDSTGGDSGIGYTDSDGYIRGIHSRTNTYSNEGMEGTHLSYAEDFILDNVNAWSYPSRKKVNGTEVIKVQSLHRGTVVDSAYTEGDITIDYDLSTCDDAAVGEFDVCEYHVTSSGEEGKLFLTNSEVVEINVPEPETSETPSGGDSGASGGDSGGSMGLLSLVGLLYIVRKRYT